MFVFLGLKIFKRQWKQTNKMNEQTEQHEEKKHTHRI